MHTEKVVTIGVAVLMIVLSPARVAHAADTHDYSTYYTLKETYAAFGVLPAASKWTPPSGKASAAMSDGECYLVPSGLLLAARGDKDKNFSAPWPGDELAIQGTLRNHVTNNRKYSPTMPHLALLPGGKLAFHSAFSTIRAKDNTLEIRGTAENPSLMDFYYSSTSDSPGYYALLEVAVVGDAESAVQFNYTGSDIESVGFQRAFRTGKGFADFLGTLKVDGAHTWLRPEVSPENFDIGGTLWITNGAGVYVTNALPTFGSLVMGAGARLRIASGGNFVTVTNSLSLADGARIEVEIGSDVLAAPESVKIMRLAPAAVPAGGIDLSGVEIVFYQSGHFEMRVGAATASDPDVEGGILVYATTQTNPIVYYNGSQEQSDSNKRGMWLDRTSAPAQWSDGLYPDGDKIYCATQTVYLTSTHSIFPGKTLIVTDHLGVQADSYVTNLYLDGAMLWGRNKNGGGNHIGGNITVINGASYISQLTSLDFYIDAALHGDQKIIFHTYYPDGDGATIHLTADNSDWTGQLATDWKDRDEAAYPCNANRHTRIVVGDAKALGGNQVNFYYGAIVMNKYLEIQFTNTTVMTASNRGIYMSAGVFRVDEGATADLLSPVTLNGKLYKRGAGTLGFGGGIRWALDSDLSNFGTPKANKNIVLVEEGAIKAKSLTHANITFSDGAGIAADTVSGALVLTGATVTAEGTIYLKADVNTLPEPTQAVVYPIVKVTSEQSETLGSAFKAVKVWKGWSAEIVSETDTAGDVTYSVRYTKKGSVLMIQ